MNQEKLRLKNNKWVTFLIVILSQSELIIEIEFLFTSYSTKDKNDKENINSISFFIIKHLVV